MVIDIVRAVAVTLLVTLMPGYFWRRALFPAVDWAESAAVTLAVSIILVSASAWLLSLSFASGITLPVAVASVIFVTGAGLAMDRRLGPSPTLDIPLDLPSESLATPALFAFVGAAAFILGTSLLDLRGDFWLGLIALLILLTAVLQAVDRQRKRAGGGEPASKAASSPVAPALSAPVSGPRSPDHIIKVRHALLAAVLLITLLRGYIGVVRHDWPYIRGVDQYAHAVMVNLVLTEGSPESFMVYPPAFPVLTAILTRLSGVAPLDLYAILAPALLVLPALSAYVLAGRLFGGSYGIAAALCVGLLLRPQGLYLRDGIYTHMIAAQFLFMLVAVALVALLNVPSLRNAVLLVFLVSGIVLYHSVATYFVVLLLGMFSALLLPHLLLRDRTRGKVILASLAATAALSLLFAWDTYDVPETVRGLLDPVAGTRATSQVAVVVGTEKPMELSRLPTYLSQPLTWLGLLGALLILRGSGGCTDWESWLYCSS